jgi:double zinc ribbon protein
MRCSKCGTDNRAGRKFCAQCGAPLKAVCPSCGVENEPGEKFCGDCGRNNTRSCDGRNGHIVRHSRRALRSDRPRCPSALSFGHRRANVRMPRGKPGRGCGKCRPTPARPPSWSWNRVRIGQSIQRADGRTYRQVGNVQIPGRRLQVTMPQQNLDTAQIGRLFQQMSGEAMPQGMG